MQSKIYNLYHKYLFSNDLCQKVMFYIKNALKYPKIALFYQLISLWFQTSSILSSCKLFHICIQEVTGISKLTLTCAVIHQLNINKRHIHMRNECLAISTHQYVQVCDWLLGISYVTYMKTLVNKRLVMLWLAVIQWSH